MQSSQFYTLGGYLGCSQKIFAVHLMLRIEWCSLCTKQPQLFNIILILHVKLLIQGGQKIWFWRSKEWDKLVLTENKLFPEGFADRWKFLGMLTVACWLTCVKNQIEMTSRYWIYTFLKRYLENKWVRYFGKFRGRR